MICLILKVAKDKDIFVLEDYTGASLSTLVGAWPSLIHSFVPIRKHVAGELGAQVYHAETKVRIVEMHVVWDAPHGDKVNVFCSLTSHKVS